MASNELAKRFVELDKRLHERSGFDCGKPELDSFLKTRALQHAKVGTSKTRVLPTNRPGPSKKLPVCAWYSISFATVKRDTYPAAEARRLPHYPVPVFLAGQLAVDRSVAGMGYGGTTLVSALRYVARVHELLPAVAVIVDCIDDQAEAFYRHYGFKSLTAIKGRARLYMPMPMALAV